MKEFLNQGNTTLQRPVFGITVSLPETGNPKDEPKTELTHATIFTCFHSTPALSHLPNLQNWYFFLYFRIVDLKHRVKNQTLLIFRWLGRWKMEGFGRKEVARHNYLLEKLGGWSKIVFCQK